MKKIDRAMSGFVANDPVSPVSFQPSEAATDGGSLRMLHDRATALGTGINGAVRRISLEYNARGLMTKIGSYSDASVGSGTLVNEVARSYDAFNHLAEDAQSHSGAVDGSTPKVGYAYADGSANTTRRLSLTYPCGKLEGNGVRLQKLDR